MNEEEENVKENWPQNERESSREKLLDRVENRLRQVSKHEPQVADGLKSHEENDKETDKFYADRACDWGSGEEEPKPPFEREAWIGSCQLWDFHHSHERSRHEA